MTDEAEFDDEGRYVAVTRGIAVRVKPVFLPRQSDPSAGQYVWAYEITIDNNGDETVQLLNRHWRITDGNGKVETVDGPGVVGQQPVIAPGRSFSYASGCPLTTPSGIMVGHYEMIAEGGDRFMIDIPAFSLDLPSTGRPLN
jgi:ApaG protein